VLDHSSQPLHHVGLQSNYTTIGIQFNNLNDAVDTYIVHVGQVGLRSDWIA